MGLYLAEQEINPDAVLVSPAVRTQETLERLRPGLGGADVWTEERLYGAGADELLGLLAELPESIGSALLVGHNPGVGELAALLARGDAQEFEIRRKFPTAALASFAVDAEWGRLRPPAARLERFVRPKDLG